MFILVSKMPDVPIGTILAWILRVDNTTNEFDVDLPDGWVRCDGSIIANGSVWAGRQVPDLNGERRFLRGGSEMEMLSLEDDQMMDHTHTVIDPEHTHPYVDKHYTHDHEGYGPMDHNSNYDKWEQSHTKTTDSKHTGITLTGVTSDYQHGVENRPKNMGIIWIIRVW